MVSGIDLFTGLVAVLVCFMLCAAWRVWVTLFVFEAVVARFAGSDYREAERNFDRNLRFLGSRSEPHGSLIDDDTRVTVSWWHYTDAAGERHEVTLSGLVQRGVAHDAARVLYIDPVEPTRVTRLGPGFWSLCTLAAAAALGWLLWYGPQALAPL